MPREAPLRQIETQSILRVEDFGAAPGDGADDSAAAQKAIEQAIKSAVPTEIVFGKGVYNFNPQGAPSSCLKLMNARNIVINGGGAEIIVGNPKSSFFIGGICENVILKNFVLDWQPLTFTQGIVKSVDQKAGAVTVELDEGFPSLEEEYFHTSAKSWGIIKDPLVPGRQKPGAPNVLTLKGWSKTGKREYEIQVGVRASFFDPGDRYVQPVSGAPFCRVFGSNQVTFENIVAYSAPGAGYVATNSSSINVLNCEFKIKPGRWHSGSRDGGIFANNRIGPWIEGCVFESLGDDGINLGGKTWSIKERIDEKTFIIAERKDRLGNTTPVRIEQGDALRVFDPVKCALAGTGVVASLEKSGNSGDWRVIFDRKMPGLEAGLEADSQMVFNDNAICGSFVIRNNILKYPRRFGILCKARDGLIEGNIFEGTSANAIIFSNEPAMGAGPAARDIVVRRNEFRDCFIQGVMGDVKDLAGVLSTGMCGVGETRRARGVERISIEDNEFSGWGDVDALRIRDANEMTIRGNRFVAAEKSNGYKAIRIENSSNIVIDGNAFAGISPPSEAISVDAAGCEGISIK